MPQNNNNLEVRKGKGGETFVKFFPFLIVVLVLALGAGAYFFLFAPALDRLKPGGQLDVAAKRDELDAAVAYLTKVSRLQENFELFRSQPDFLKVEQAVPSVLDLPGLLVSLEAIATQGGLRIQAVEVTESAETGPRQVVPSTPAASAAPSAIPAAPSGFRKVNLVLRVGAADYGSFKEFLMKIESSLRLLDVISYNFDPRSDQQNLSLVTYYYKP